ncbi:MAG: TonB-dependent receptor, partial [Gammaproteobacteria bacterium]
FIGANGGAILKSFYIARVEVLRGPQGTLFGRNTIGGVINVERSKPTGEFGGKVRASYGDYDAYNVEGIVNFGVTEDLAVKLSGAKREQKEGYYKNTFSGDDVGRSDYQTLGVNFLLSSGEDMEFEYTYQWEDTDQDTPPLLNNGQQRHLFCFAFNYCSPSEDSTITGDRYKVSNRGLFPPNPLADSNPANDVFNATPYSALRAEDLAATFGTDTHILEWRWDFAEDYRFDAIYGHWNSSETVLTDWDGTPDLLYHTTRPANYKQDSLELRVSHTGAGALTWVAGAYLWNSEYDINLRSYIGFAAPNTVLDILQYSSQETDSQALFFEADYDVSDRLTFTVGGRYTEDEKESRQRGQVNTSTMPNPATGIVEGDPNEDWNEFTPKIGARYQLTDDAMLYATYSIGYRSGGFNGRVASYAESVTPYDQETVTNYEIGFKSEWLDRT